MTSGSDLRGQIRGLKPAVEMAARNGRVRLRLQIPKRHVAALERRTELKLTQHIQAAVARLLAAKKPAIPAEVDIGDPDDAQQVWVDQQLATRVEEAFGGVERREAAILTAIARYLERR